MHAASGVAACATLSTLTWTCTFRAELQFARHRAIALVRYLDLSCSEIMAPGASSCAGWVSIVARSGRGWGPTRYQLLPGFRGAVRVDCQVDSLHVGPCGSALGWTTRQVEVLLDIDTALEVPSGGGCSDRPESRVTKSSLSVTRYSHHSCNMPRTVNSASLLVAAYLLCFHCIPCTLQCR